MAQIFMVLDGDEVVINYSVLNRDRTSKAGAGYITVAISFVNDIIALGFYWKLEN